MAYQSKLVGSVSANDINALGVSPAKSYGHVAGTSARFFGQGIISLPRLNDEHPFKVYIKKEATGSYYFKSRKGFVDGKQATGGVGNAWTRIVPLNQSVILEATISKDMDITKAEVKADKINEPFRAKIDGGVQTIARIIIAQFDQDGSELTVIQNVTTNLISQLVCLDGYAAKILVQEAVIV
jgi:hypothetical protein